MHPSPPSPARKRVRLAPAVRKQLILDAALSEFSTHGFGATSTETIAQRAGLSQAGLYAHFKSKEAILQALFSDALLSEWSQWLSEDTPFTEARLDRLIDYWYQRVAEPRFLAVFRLLIAESTRLTEGVLRWRELVVDPFLAEQQRIVDSLVARGLMRESALSDHFQLAQSPLVFVMLMHLFDSGERKVLDQELNRMRESHRALLKQCLVLEPDHVPISPA